MGWDLILRFFIKNLTRESLNEFGAIILDAAITVPRESGTGLLASAYQHALKRVLELRGLHVQAYVPVELAYKEIPLGKMFEIDLLVEEEIII